MDEPLAPAQERQLRAGLAVIAAEASPPAVALPGQPRRRWRLKAAAAVAASLVIAAAGAALVSGDRPDRTDDGVKPKLYDLATLAAGSETVVIGTVREITESRLGTGSRRAYVLATVDVVERLRGSAGDQLIAFDYADPAAPWRTGERIVLFLTSSAGTVHETVEPPHMQVVGGRMGRIPFVDGRLDASFSLHELRAHLARATG